MFRWINWLVRGCIVAVLLCSFSNALFAGPDWAIEVEILRGSGGPDKSTQIVNKNFPIWSKEFDTTLDMGKAVTHRFREGDHEWNYDGRSGFSTGFHFSN